jgi:hypothetical protein
MVSLKHPLEINLKEIGIMIRFMAKVFALPAAETIIEVILKMGLSPGSVP